MNVQNVGFKIMQDYPQQAHADTAEHARGGTYHHL